VVGVTTNPALVNADDRLVWIDLEMTGLDVDRDVIVEIAVLVTNGQLQLLDPEGLDLVVQAQAAALAAMDDVVVKMHTKSGLLTAIEASELTLADALAQTLAYVQRFVPAPNIAPLCGNTIGMDRRFLNKYAPELDEYLHYRSIDVSSLKELCRRWYPDIYRQRPGKKETHRALDDIRESIEELRFYRQHLLVPARGVSDAPASETN